MSPTIDCEVENLSDRKLWDIVRLAEIVATDTRFLRQVHAEIAQRQCYAEAHQLQRYLHSAALVDQYGRETPITEEMVDRACGPLSAMRLICVNLDDRRQAE